LVKLRNGRWLKVKLPKGFNYEITSFRLKLVANDLYVDVVYKYPLEVKEPKGDFKAGIDIGLDELLAVVSDNPNLKSFIVSGKELKAFNQWFNKEKAKLQSQIDTLKNELKKRGEELSKELIETIQKEIRELEIKLKVLSAHRKRKLDNDLHKIARKLVDLLYEMGHKTIYIGKNALESKNGINLGKKLNQEFVSIPFRKLINLVKYKAQELGMEVVEIDEAYTSKTSPFADIFKVRKTKNTKYCLGQRKGNLFRDFISGKLFHADLVGALNILRVGAKFLILGFYGNLKVLFVKLANPKRFKLIEFFYEVWSREATKWDLRS
jgi:IS605 OrfB family transposase